MNMRNGMRSEERLNIFLIFLQMFLLVLSLGKNMPMVVLRCEFSKYYHCIICELTFKDFIAFYEHIG